MSYYLNFDTTQEALESGIIDSICPYPGPMDSIRMPINGETFTADTYQLVSPQNMTSNSLPSPYIVFASSYQNTYEAYKAFDSYDITRWLSNPGIINYETYGIHNIAIDLGSSHEINRIKLMPGDNGNYNPIYIKIYIFNSSDNINWTLLYTSAVLSSTSWLALQDGGGYYTFDINDLNVSSGRYYKLCFAAVDNNGDNDVGRYFSIGVAKIELYTSAGGNTTFTIPRLKRKTGRGRAYASDTYYNTNILFIKNEKILIENVDYIINNEQITFSVAPASTDEILATQYPNGPMWFVEIPSDLYSVIPLSSSGNLNNIIPIMSSNITPSPYRASASSEQVGNEAYNAFDGLVGINKGWLSNDNTSLQYLEFDFASNIQSATSFTILPFGMTNTAPTKKSPIMTSNTTPSPYIISASSEQSSHEAYKACDGSFLVTSGWLSNAGTTHWLQIDLGTAQTVNSYVIFPFATDTEVQGLTRFSLQGSNNLSDWHLLGVEQIGVTGWEVNAPKFFDASNETAYRYYRLHIINDSVSTAGIAEIELYYSSGNVTVSNLDKISFQASNNRIDWISLYTVDNLSDTWTFGMAKTFSLSNTNYYRYYRLYIWPNAGQNIGISKLEIRSVKSNQVKNRVILNASLSQVEPGYKKIRIKYYDSTGVLQTEYFNVPFWDNYKLDADDLNDYGDYFYSMLSNLIDDTGFYSIIRDSNFETPNGIISRINRTFYSFDNSIHSENIIINRNADKYITNIEQYIDGALVQKATITRDFENLINVINLEGS